MKMRAVEPFFRCCYAIQKYLSVQTGMDKILIDTRYLHFKYLFRYSIFDTFEKNSHSLAMTHRIFFKF
jgi:hypothetical protein